MNNCYFFGDSFTSMNVLQSSWYMEYVKNKTGSIKASRYIYEKRWSTLMSNELEVNEYNFGKDGISNDEIINIILENIPNMNSGDYCFIQSTVPTRIMGYNKFTEQIQSINTEHLYDESQLKENVKEYVDSQNDITSLVDYITDNILSNSKSWDDYYFQKYNTICDILNDKGVNVVFFTYEFWNKFETIKEETNGTINDDHWSPKGNESFFKFLLNEIKTQDTYPIKLTMKTYINPI